MSSTAYRLVRLAVLEARMLKSEDIDVEHLLLAIFHNNEKSNADFLAPFISAGVTYNALYSALNENPARLGGAEAAYGAGAGDDDDDDDDDDELPGQAPKAPRSSSQQAATSAPRKGGNDTPVLDKFGNDMTLAAEQGRLDPVVGRETEIERLAQILSRRKKNNPVLIGEPGSRQERHSGGACAAHCAAQGEPRALQQACGEPRHGFDRCRHKISRTV